MKKYFHIIVFFFLNISIFLVLQLLGNTDIIERMGNSVNDLLTYKVQYTQFLHKDDIVILKIDDKTLDTLWKSDLGMIAFDKGVYAQVLQKIFEEYHAAVVWVDILFSNPSVLWKEDEEKLAQVFETYRDSIVIATKSDYTPYPLCIYAQVQHGFININAEKQQRTFPLDAVPYNLEPYCAKDEISSQNTGNISSFPREILEQYQQKTNPFQKEKIQNNLARFDALERDTSHIVYFSNGKRHEGTIGYESYSFLDIFQGLQTTTEGKKIDLEGKIILIGEVGSLVHDSHFTPIDQNKKMPGVEINANIIQTLLQGAIFQEASVFLHFLLFFSLQMIISWSVVSLRISRACMICVVGIWALIAFTAFSFVYGYIYNIFLWIVGATLSFFIAYIYRFQVTDKAKRMMKKQFSLYVSPDVVEEMSRHPDELLIQGEKREMSIFFSDIVSFTNISEAMAPEKLVQLLNEYFSEMTKIIHHHKGTLDKYIGDSVMCFFNAPLLQENHSYYACITALEQQKKLKLLNQTWQAQGYPEIKIRIGLHCGEAIHGNIGSTDTRVSYTIMGDSVNLASRLEGVCKEYGIYICVSENIYTLQKDMFHFRELDTIAVKGKTQAVRIYQLIGPKNIELPAGVQEHFQKYAEALEIYRRGEYALAGKKWLENKSDPTSYLMAQRCRDILDSKARVEQGVFIMTHK